MSTDDAPKIHVDADWKAEAQAERDRLAEAEDKHTAKQDASKGLPPADFKGLVGLLAAVPRKFPTRECASRLPLTVVRMIAFRRLLFGTLLGNNISNTFLFERSNSGGGAHL